MRVFQRILDRTLSAYWIARAPHIFRLLRPERGDLILEVGCGTGNWTAAFTDTGAHVVALDIRLDRARSAKQRAGEAAHVLVASAEALPFAQEAFAKVTCIDVIEHVDKDAWAATELVRVLKTDGHLVITTLRQDRSSILRRVEFDDHLREYSWERFSSLSQGAGLKILETFGFYRWFSKLAWEGQYMIADASWMRRIPGLSTLLWAILSVVARLDPLVRTPGAGLGQIAEKPKRVTV